jgi:hypothetical protein
MAEALGQSVALSEVHLPLGHDSIPRAAKLRRSLRQNPARGESGRACSSVLIHQSARPGSERRSAEIVVADLRKQRSQFPTGVLPSTIGSPRSKGCSRQNAATSWLLAISQLLPVGRAMWFPVNNLGWSGLTAL